MVGIYDVTFTMFPNGDTDYSSKMVGSESEPRHRSLGVTSMSKVDGICMYTVNVVATSVEEALQLAAEYTVMFPDAGERIIGEEEVDQSEGGSPHSTVA